MPDNKLDPADLPDPDLPDPEWSNQSLFICPLDGLPLAHPLNNKGNSLRCKAGHSFDVAREGYVNLLPAQHRPSRDPGDSKAMVSARLRVHESGLFEPLSDTVNQLVRQQLDTLRSLNKTSHNHEKGGRPQLIVDAACGDGYFTDRLQQSLYDIQPQPASTATTASTESTAGSKDRIKVSGTDISKWCVRAAAKRNPNCLWAVANNTNLPFARGTIDIITSLFGFPTWQAWTQLQIIGQRVLVVDAGVDHLIELREKLYKTVRKHAAPTHEKAIIAGYKIIREQACQYTGQLTSAQLLLPLAQMTPHAYRSDRERLDHLAQLGTKDKASTTSMTIDLVIREYEKTNDT